MDFFHSRSRNKQEKEARKKGDSQYATQVQIFEHHLQRQKLYRVLVEDLSSNTEHNMQCQYESPSDPSCQIKGTLSPSLSFPSLCE